MLLYGVILLHLVPIVRNKVFGDVLSQFHRVVSWSVDISAQGESNVIDFIDRTKNEIGCVM